MNNINWRSLPAETKLLLSGAEYEFKEISKDDIVCLKQTSGLRRLETLTIVEAREIPSVQIVPNMVETSEVFHDDDLLRLDHLTARDFDQTIERMALVEAAKVYETSNPSATKSAVAKHARKAAFDKVWAEKFLNHRKSGVKSLKHGFSQRTAEHYLLKYERRGLEGIISKESGSGRIIMTPRADPVFIAIAARASAEWRDGRLVNKHETWKVFQGLVSKTFHGNLKPPGMISRRTFERWLDDLPRYEILSDRNGAKYADDTLAQRDIRRRPQHAFDELEIDCKYFDCEAIADPLVQFAANGSEKKARPILVVIVDCKTGYLPAFRIFPGSPSALAVQETVISAFKDQAAWRLNCGLPASNGVRLEGFGALKSDGGNEFVSRESRACYAKLNIDFENGAAGKPHHRGKIEGVNAIISTFVCWLPAQLGRNSVDRKNRAEVIGDISIDELNRWFAIWVDQIYHQEVSWASHGLTRVEAVIQDQKSRALRPVPSSKLLEKAITVSGVVMANRYGLRFENHLFNSPELANFVRKFGKRRVEVKMFANNIGSIDALLNGQWVTIPNTDPHYNGVSLSNWRLINAGFVFRGKTIGNACLNEVVEATMTLQSRMNEITRKNGVSVPINISGEVLKLIDASYENKSAQTLEPENASEPKFGRVGIDLSDFE